MSRSASSRLLDVNLPAKRVKHTDRFEKICRSGDIVFGLYDQFEPYQRKVHFLLQSMSKLNKDSEKRLCLFTRSKEKPYNSRKRITYKKPYHSYIKKLAPNQQKQLKFLDAHKDYLFKARHRPLFKDDEWINDVFVHRMCKLSVVSSQITGRRIHFILDGIDHERVVKKIDPATGGRDYSRTSAELRALYRCRDLLDSNMLFFYKDGVRVDPPWEHEVHQHWYNFYQVTRNLKSQESRCQPTLWQVVRKEMPKSVAPDLPPAPVPI